MTIPLRTLVATLVLSVGGVAHAQPVTAKSKKPEAEPAHVLVKFPAKAPPGFALSPAPSAAKVLELPEKPLDAKLLTAGQLPRQLDLAAGPAALRQGEVLVTKTAAVATRQAGGTVAKKGAVRWILPFQYRFLEAQGAVRTSHIVVEVAGGGLRMIAPANQFRGLVYVALEDQQDPTRTYSLPIAAHVLVTAPIDQVEPASFDIAGTNRWTEVGLQALDPPEPVRAKVRASTDAHGLEIEIPVERPKLSVRVSPEAIQGLGLELATVEVVAEGLPQPGHRKVTLSATKGSLSGTLLELDDQGRAEARMRSIAVGTTRVDAVSPPLRQGEASATFIPPWAFLLWAVLGGGIGAVIRRAQGRQRVRRPVLIEALIGALVGIVVSVLYAIGINVLPVTPSATAGEALVFGIAALAGFLGLRVPKAG